MQDSTQPLPLPRIGLSQGDFNGIGYELMLKTFSDARMFESLTPVLYGQSKVFSYYKKNFAMELPNYSLTRDARQAWDKKFNIINMVEQELKIEPGLPSNVSAEMSVRSMKRAADDLRNGIIDALVMTPDSPLVAQSNRDFLMSFFKDANPVQVLVNGTMRVALATGDMPLRSALDKMDTPYLVGKLVALAQALKTDFNIASPKIAVMGLNPHSGATPAGDDEKVVKAVKEAQDKGVFAFGPFSSSQLFVAGWWKKYDAVMALHYEQGVFPMRFLSNEGYAYYWAGLPVVCAAPLHGPAFDIANQNLADPVSYRKALFLAADIVDFRRQQ